MNNALNGAHILVTRPAHQAEDLCHLIERQGGVAVRFPALAIVGTDAQTEKSPGGQFAATNPLAKLSKYHCLIFISANAVNFALKANGGKITGIGAPTIVAVGPATARALESAGVSATVIPEQGFNSEALLAMPLLQAVKGRDILIVRGQGGREELAEGLRSRGANIDYWEVYKRVMPTFDRSEGIALLEKGLLDIIIITSGEALQNLVIMVGKNYKENLTIIPLVVISDRIRRLAVERGFKKIAVSENPSDQAILATAIAIINGE